MKPYLITSLLFICVSCCVTKGETIENGQEKNYEVYKIDSVNSFYLIYCKREGQKYKIVSEKKIVSSNGYIKVQIGDNYNFLLKTFPSSNPENPLTNNTSLLVNCYMFDKETQICKEVGTNGLFIVPDLIGLYIKKENE